MGGSSSNKSAQTDNTNYDNRAIQQEENSGIQVLGEGNTIHSTTTDHGAMDAAEEIAQTAGKLGANAFDTADSLGQNAMSTAVNLASISAETTEASFDFAESVALDSLDGMQELSADVVDKLAQSNFDNTQVIAGISSSQMRSNDEQLNAITELAKSAQTGGATEMSKQQTKVIAIAVVGGIVMIGFIMWGMKTR
ncbi:hypothetical protein [Psychromonas sp. Urea-02u-13]|uniref:hypothetical protein n=1 Tax=Psychromonas sp. Urea-02u-13 TaxID=2058326 RepID=UPI000C34EC29|nr:hypothetical protein [Psychromonas sp. Urea-02u-13]PKG39702.1 hypothetical protein CXF74_07050 [Psychromonas sp. Urea-02u-13]